MGARKKKKASRHGATQPEGSRLRKQVLLRLSPAHIAELDRLAVDMNASKSDVVEQAIDLLAAEQPSKESK